MNPNTMKAPLENGTIILKRTFNQSDFNGRYIKYWRVMGPKNHRNLGSDLSIQGLTDWGIIQLKGGNL